MIEKIKIGNKIISCKICKTPTERAIGLMFAPKYIDAAFFIFDKIGKYDIHSCFVPKEFHAFFMDKDLNPVDSIKNIQPWRLIIRHKGHAKYLFEVFTDVGINRITNEIKKALLSINHRVKENEGQQQNQR